MGSIFFPAPSQIESPDPRAGQGERLLGQPSKRWRFGENEAHQDCRQVGQGTSPKGPRLLSEAEVALTPSSEAQGSRTPSSHRAVKILDQKFSSSDFPQL